jgi:Putative peptidoglycan binding domain
MLKKLSLETERQLQSTSTAINVTEKIHCRGKIDSQARSPMVSVRSGLMLLLATTLAIFPAIASRTHRPPTAGHSKKSRRATMHGQRAIDSSRATQIQTALIQKKYLSGSPTGQWDTQTQTAMQRYQADHGWQTKLMPDSRALISLGLGPTSTPADAMAVSEAHSASSGAPPPEQNPSAEPGANTLASVHSISQ